MSAIAANYPNPLSARLAARTNTLLTTTASLTPSYLQANLLVLPSAYAASFHLLCQRNPVPCPLLGETVGGDPKIIKSYIPGVECLAQHVDLRRDAPGYMIYENGVRVSGGEMSKVTDICKDWTSDHVGFLIGCSFSFEGALTDAGLRPRHQLVGKTVPMYRTNIPLNPAGVFMKSTYVVSMRPYKANQVERVREITRAYGLCHGEPIAWGWEAVEKLGIDDLGVPDWGDSPELIQDDTLLGEEGEALVPLFWGCGVTPQEAVMRAGDKIQGVVMGHEPGHMIILDARDSDITGSDWVGTEERGGK